MARRPRTKRPRDDSDDEDIQPQTQRLKATNELSNVPSPTPESDGEAVIELPVLDDEPDENAPPSSPKGDAKHKKATDNTSPSVAQDEAELARRRRRRQSLVFQKRRQSLTPSNPRGSSAASDDGDQPPANRQYISDMYSTIIKMSSENKINIKNTWSLHLIDHMEDILSAPQVERPGELEDPNTFNFQKASCTLDASVKIYSYRVDDTWTSSYKILENLSRSGGDRKADNEEGDEDDEDVEGAEEGEDGTQRRGKKKTARKPASAAKTIEKNMNNITLKSYELDFEPDPLFHKMSQTFDEGGAKGMLLANLSVYDGAKILLNSADVQLSTRKIIKEKERPVDDGELTPTEEDAVKPRNTPKIDLSLLGKLSCFSKDVTSVPVCPPLSRLYDQIEELRDPDRTQQKIVLRKPVLTLAPRREKVSDEESFIPSTPVPEENFIDSAESTEDDNGFAPMDDSEDVPPVEEADDANETGDDDDDDAAEENNDPDDQSFEFGGGDDVDVEMEEADTASSVSTTEATVPADENPADTSALDVNEDDNEPVTERHVDPVTQSTDEPKPVVVKSAADYFRSQMEDNTVKNEEDIAYSQLIETALMRSVILEAEGTEATDGNDYSYFDAKLLKNWAGPSHLKFRGARRLPTSLLAIVDEQEEGSAPAKRGRKPQTKKSTTVAAEKRSLVVDFHSSDVPDFAKLLKVPKTAASTVLTKLVVKRQMQKSAELVFPVDAHIESNIFFRHFLKPRLQLFHRRLHPSRGLEVEETHLPSASDPGLADADNLAFEDHGHDFGRGGFSDDDVSDNEFERDGSSEFFSSANLITAERVVEKVDVHYERVAKRVDVKKLKTSLWSHLESETALLGKRKSRQSDVVEPDPERSEEDPTIEPTTFENVVQGIAGKVPSNVTVSFYFICMLHLANEKGLRFTGKEDLSDFAIKKEEPLHHS